jgi:hypothetical protein
MKRGQVSTSGRCGNESTDGVFYLTAVELFLDLHLVTSVQLFLELKLISAMQFFLEL